MNQLCADTRYSVEDLQGAIDDRDGWQERAKELEILSITEISFLV